MKLLERGKITKGELNKIIRNKTDKIFERSNLNLRPKQYKPLEALLRQAVESVSDDILATLNNKNSDTIKLRRLKEIEEEIKALEEEKLNLLYDVR